MSKKTVPYDAVPFTSKRGDTFNPGDACIALTRSSGQPGLSVGKYLGTRQTKSRWHNRPVETRVVMEVTRDNFKFVTTTTLQNNDIYPGDVALKDVKL